MKKQLGNPPKTSYLSEQILIEGKITSKNDVIINAKIVGEVVGEAETIVETESDISGSIKSHELVVKGSVEGTIEASHLLEIQPEAQIHGDIVSPKGALIIGQGAQIQGVCNMTQSSDPIKS